jgi:hypothetical protein
MSNADTQHMVDLVERQTGYRVTVDVVSSIYEHAQMISPRPVAILQKLAPNAAKYPSDQVRGSSKKYTEYRKVKKLSK